MAMGFYGRYILPALTAWVMRDRSFYPYRSRAAEEARGRVLEVGIGSGENLRFYPQRVQRVVGIDPSVGLLRRARYPRERRQAVTQLVQGSAEELPFGAGCFDTVLLTWALCSIPDAAKALQEFRRVLAPGGRLLFVEHGLAPEAGVRRWQHRLTPMWRRVAGGCHLDRPVDALVQEAGFMLERMETGYAMPGLRAFTYFYEGRARP